MRHRLLVGSPPRRGRPGPADRLACAALGVLLSCALAGCATGSATGPEATATASASSAGPSAGTSDGTSAGTSAGTSGPEDPAAHPADEPLAGLSIAIDPGHNGGNGAHPDRISASVPDGRGGEKACNTVGTSSDDGYPEHRFTWETAQAVRTALGDAGATVVLSRSSDDGVGPCVDERGTFADDADALVSLHGNGTEDRSARGFHVITAPVGGRGDEATAQASAELGRAMVDACEEAGLERNPAYDGLVVRDDLATLNNAAVPAVLLEAGEMRNAEDAELLASPDGQERIAAAVVTALTAVLGDQHP